MEHNQNTLDSGGLTGEKHISGEHAWWETSDFLHCLLGGCTRHSITSVYEKPWPVYRFLPFTWHWQSQPRVVQLIQQVIRPLSSKLSSLKVSVERFCRVIVTGSPGCIVAWILYTVLEISKARAAWRWAPLTSWSCQEGLTYILSLRSRKIFSPNSHPECRSWGAAILHGAHPRQHGPHHQ